MLQPIIPVIDLQRGVVVRGIAGERDAYQPIQSMLTHSSAPRDIAVALVERFGFRTAYLADLDAIAGAAPNVSIYEELRSIGLELWIDAGIRALAEISRYGDAVIGLESLVSPRELPQLIDNALDPAGLLFSLDLRHGKLWTNSPHWQNLSPQQVIQHVVNAGITRCIVLDVAAVGTHSGPATLELGQLLHQRWPALTLIGGGGVRDARDIAAFVAAGYQHVLVASALHDGRIAGD